MWSLIAQSAAAISCATGERFDFVALANKGAWAVPLTMTVIDCGGSAKDRCRSNEYSVEPPGLTEPVKLIQNRRRAAVTSGEDTANLA